ncbi:IclR family transcriptional regulator domain-containing protein [Propylenella binzhouense]|uniref:IclR family transcriptional regulator n=1 Tax=Propylenella binzhouense TaxID=2555902 RepID=A0A964T316_9HYPH|nr:IclR family transcriptional regulator C-terminal domain-containing protein [Propylenella binzhouense]MYZ47576.1 IclR family transcriptional regulator [Propylenella binzhouense]
MSESESWFVTSFARGLSVLRAFGPHTPQLKLSEVAKSANMSRAAARRFLKTLEALGYVGSQNDRFYLRAKVLELGFAYLSSMDFQELAKPYLDEIARQAGGSSCISVLDDGEVVFVARAVAEQRIRLVANIGSRYPAYAVSMGRAILANLPPAELDRYCARVRFKPLTEYTISSVDQLRTVLAAERARGWYGCKDETRIGVTAIAVPIFDEQGQARAAVNLNLSGQFSDPEQVADLYLASLRDCAAHLSRALTLNLIPVSV